MQKSKITSYSFTYRRNVRKEVFPTPADYDSILEQLRKIGTIKHHVFELDSRGKLHVHGILEAAKGLKYKDCTVKGYSSNFKEIFNLKGWVDYMEKDPVLARKVDEQLWWVPYHHDADRPKSPDFTKNLMPRRSPRPDNEPKERSDRAANVVSGEEPISYQPYSDTNMERRIADVPDLSAEECT